MNTEETHLYETLLSCYYWDIYRKTQMWRQTPRSSGQPAVFKIVVHCGALSDVYQGSSALCLIHNVTIVYSSRKSMSRHGQCFNKLHM